MSKLLIFYKKQISYIFFSRLIYSQKMVRINVGINGLGRIGKCILLQLLENDNFNIKAINVSSLRTNSIQKLSLIHI